MKSAGAAFDSAQAAAKIRVIRLKYLLIYLSLILLHLSGFTTDLQAQENNVISLNLEEAISLALEANRSLLNSASSVENQKLSLHTAESEFDVKIRPSANAGISDAAGTLGAGMSLEKKFQMGTKVSVSPYIGKSEDEYSGTLGISFEVPLLKGFGGKVNLDRTDRSRFSLRTAERSFFMSQVNVVLDTVSAVYDIIKQKEIVRLFESQGGRLKEHAETAKIKEKVGLASPLDIFRAEIRLKDSEDSLTFAKEALRNAGDRLKLILAIPLEQTAEVSAPLEPEAVLISPDEAFEIALNNRIEFQQAEDEIREAERRSDIAKHNILPQLDMVMNYERYDSSQDLGKSMSFNEDRWSLNLVSNTDISRTSEKADFQQSLIIVRTARLNLETKRDEIMREVRRESESLNKSQERILIRKEQIRQAEGKLALSKIKFNHGMADNFDIIEAETELQQARVNLLSSQTDYIVGIYRLRAALGTLISEK